MNIEKYIKKFSNLKILVVGDVMLDRYWFGDVTRISPEAPVPIVNVIKEDYRLGGAANVANNIAALGGKTSLLSIVGDDEEGNILSKILCQKKIIPNLIKDQKTRTIVKLRILGVQQQLLRVDFEKPISNIALDELMSKYEKLVSDHDIVIMSDYGKGCLGYSKKMIDLVKKANKKILVDPKGINYNRYDKANIITPNKKELHEAIGNWSDEKDLCNKVKTFISHYNLDAILLTRSEEGMTLYTPQKTQYLRANALEVFDVSGAGDTVIATLGLMIASGANYEDAAKAANAAAGVVVGKIGTAVLSPSELIKAIGNSGVFI